MDAADSAPAMLPAPPKIIIVVGGDVTAEEASRLTKSLKSSSAVVETVNAEALDEDAIKAGDAAICSPFEGPTFALLTSIEGLRIYGPSVCDQGLPRHSMQLYAATLSNPSGQPLAVHISLPDTIVRRELEDRLRWMGARCTADDEPADMYLANVHNVITKAAREAGKPVVRPLWVSMCWQQFLDSKGVLVEGDREYRLPPLAGCKIAFAMVGVTQRTREIMHDCAKQCGATILDDVDENCTHFICTYSGKTKQFERAKQVGAYTVGSKWLLLSRSHERWMDEHGFLIRDDLKAVKNEDNDHAAGRFSKRRRTNVKSTAVTQGVPSPTSAHAIASLTGAGQMRPRASTAEADTLSSIRKRKHHFGGREDDSDDELDDDERDQMKRADVHRQSPAKNGTLAADVARASPAQAGRARSAPELFHQAVSEAARNAERDLKRKRRTEEMFKCEKSLSRKLEILQRRFILPLRENGFMDRATLNFVFAGMNKIQDLSREVGQDLEQKLNDWETGATIIAHVFYEERMKIYSKLYKRVVTNTDRARAILERELKSNRAFAAFVSREEKAPEMERQRLIDMINLPMQHIMRYALHLKEIIKNTPAQHPDSVELVDVHRQFAQILELTNEARGMNDKLQEVAELRAHMEGLPAEVISGASTLLRTTEPAMEVKDGSMQRRELILFTDQILVASIRPKSVMGTLTKASMARAMARAYKYRSHWPLDTCIATELAGFDQHALVENDKTHQSITLKFESQERLRTFLADVRDVVKLLRGSLPAPMQADEDNALAWERDEAMHARMVEQARNPVSTFGEDADNISVASMPSPSQSTAAAVQFRARSASSVSRHDDASFGRHALPPTSEDGNMRQDYRRESFLHRLWRNTARRSSRSASKVMDKLRRTGSKASRAKSAQQLGSLPAPLQEQNGGASCPDLMPSLAEHAAEGRTPRVSFRPASVYKN